MLEPITSFNLYDVFIGEETTFIYILVIILKTIFIYFYALLNIRFLGKRSVAQLTAFELLIVIALGTAIGDPMIYYKVHLIYSMIAITTIVIVENLVTALVSQFSMLEALFKGRPTLVIKDACILEKKIKQEGISLDEIMIMLRHQGIEYLGQVKYGIFEPSGKLSVIKYSQPKVQGMSTLDKVLAKQSKK